MVVTLASLLLLAAAGTVHPQSNSPVVIASPDVAIRTLTAEELRQIVSGDRQFWDAGHPVTLILPAPGTAAREYLFRGVLHMSESAYRRHTLSLLYRGELDYAPRVVGSASEAIAFAEAGRGVLSVILSSEFDSTRVRLVRIVDRSHKR